MDNTARGVRGFVSRPAEDRFWEKVDRAGGSDACWPWVGARTAHGGYGNFWDGERLQRAHRFAWQLAIGRPPIGMVLHSCDSPPCCNARHLFEGNHAANMADRQAKGRTRTGNLNGEASPRCRWADAEVARVRELREQGMTLRGIAAHLSMPKSTVASIIAGRHRREVTRVRESL